MQVFVQVQETGIYDEEYGTPHGEQPVEPGGPTS